MSETLVKESQYYNNDNVYIEEDDNNYIGHDDVYLNHYTDDSINVENDDSMVVDFHDTEEEALEIIEDDVTDQNDLVFLLPDVPGALDAEDINIEVPQTEEEKTAELWDWQSGGIGNFLHWLHNMITNPPEHSGKDTTGLEKAISYFEALDKEITKAMRNDFKNEISSAKAEEARAAIEDGLDRLVNRLEKVKSSKFKRHKKKGSNNSTLIKEGQKATHIGGVVITVPLFISRIARVCINGMVSAGHDIEDLFDKQVKMYNLDKREKAEVLQLLADMGYPLHRDRGLDFDEEFDRASTDNWDYAADYVA